MARITMKKTDEITVEQAFSLFFRAASARGATDKTLQTYKHHSRALFKRCDGSVCLKILHNNFYKKSNKGTSWIEQNNRCLHMGNSGISFGISLTVVILNCSILGNYFKNQC